MNKPLLPRITWVCSLKKGCAFTFSLDLSRGEVVLNTVCMNQVPRDSFGCFWPSTQTASFIKECSLWAGCEARRIYGGAGRDRTPWTLEGTSTREHPEEGQHSTSCLLRTSSGLGHLSPLPTVPRASNSFLLDGERTPHVDSTQQCSGELCHEWKCQVP